MVILQFVIARPQTVKNVSPLVATLETVHIIRIMVYSIIYVRCNYFPIRLQRIFIAVDEFRPPHKFCSQWPFRKIPIRLSTILVAPFNHIPQQPAHKTVPHYSDEYRRNPR